MKVLVTGGAGFIGSHLVLRLLREGCEVSVLDNFSSQVHGNSKNLPPGLQGQVRLHVGDVRDKEAFAKALDKQEVVVHLAAETGVGQSMYEIERYQEVNIGGTACLLQHLLNNKSSTVRKLVLASSRAVYGEGKHHCSAHGNVYPALRRPEDLRRGCFEPRCPLCGEACEPRPTPEESPLQPLSFYGLTKQVQEQMTLMLARTLGLSAFALRYQNVYGPGQSLKNPYTGILAVFSSQARAGQPINVFEDGLETRDFVYVDDVVEATWRCIVAEGSQVEALNIGTGERITVLQVAQEIGSFFSSRSQVVVSGAFRQGDIRHNFADLAKARSLIGYEPHWRFTEGLKKFLDWAAAQDEWSANYESSLQEMRERGLLNG